jgi:hypothetical protein
VSSNVVSSSEMDGSFTDSGSGGAGSMDAKSL